MFVAEKPHSEYAALAVLDHLLGGEMSRYVRENLNKSAVILDGNPLILTAFASSLVTFLRNIFFTKTTSSLYVSLFALPGHAFLAAASNLLAVTPVDAGEMFVHLDAMGKDAVHSL